MLGVCYHPEHWPEARWSEDARRMKTLGLTYVRVGEFAWSRLEPQPGQFDFGWLDRVLETLGSAGLRVVLGTPTASPPKWLVDRTPHMLAVDLEDRPRGFGSRRHYCFSSTSYMRECERIVTVLGGRYGQHAAVAGWQTDNQYGCHDTVRCYCDNCRDAFRSWLQRHHGSLEALNQAWGNVFWSMEYRSWDEVELPHRTVTEANPSHWLDFSRFASDQVVAFNRLQVEVLRRLSPKRFLAHNYLGFSTDFDHFRVAEDLDVASWDSSPLAFTDLFPLPAETKQRYARTGHPDIAAFHHDLYRGVGHGRWWVMGQQPGPVNWAPHNPSPAPGMVRLWTWEALAHGAEVVSYFRWRQIPFAQEQMHAGLNRPDFAPDVGFFEVERTARETTTMQLGAASRAPVALVFDYEAAWVLSIQPQGAEFQYKTQVLEWYTAIRRLGFDVDIVPPGARLDGYVLVLVPTLPIISDAALKAFESCRGTVVFGPRSGSKTAHFQLPQGLPPGPLQRFLDLKVTRVESLAPDLSEQLEWQGQSYEARLWLEHLDAGNAVQARLGGGKPALVNHGRFHYLGCVAETAFLMDWFEALAREANLEPLRLPEGVRLRTRGGITFAFNSDPDPWRAPVPPYARLLLGDGVVPPQGVCAWR